MNSDIQRKISKTLLMISQFIQKVIMASIIKIPYKQLFNKRCLKLIMPPLLNKNLILFINLSKIYYAINVHLKMIGIKFLLITLSQKLKKLLGVYKNQLKL
jgi:hypothetical protein